MTDHDPECIRMQDEQHKGMQGNKRWIIEESANGYTVHVWQPDGVAPQSTYQNKRLAVARLLQIMEIGPVAPQMHPEEICITSLYMEPQP